MSRLLLCLYCHKQRLSNVQDWNLEHLREVLSQAPHSTETSRKVAGNVVNQVIM